MLNSLHVHWGPSFPTQEAQANISQASSKQQSHSGGDDEQWVQTDQTSTERRGGGYHLICLRGVDPVQDALNSVQFGMQGLDALLCPLFGLERPQCLGWHGDLVRVTVDKTKGQRKTATPRCYGHAKPPSVVPGPPADCSPRAPISSLNCWGTCHCQPSTQAHS